MAQINKNFEFEQGGKTYSLYDLPAGFVIKGKLLLSGKELDKLPNLSRVIVEGDFFCSNNNLTDLEGAPQKVGGTFYCGDNNITSLEGCPREVGGDFYCCDNQLTSLKGGPQKVGGSFFCYNNKLTDLKGIAGEIGGRISCHGNQLESLFISPPQKDELAILCDRKIAEKYGLADSMTYGRLKATTLYAVQLHAYMIVNKKHLDRVREGEERKNRLKSGFAPFKEKRAKEREE